MRSFYVIIMTSLQMIVGVGGRYCNFYSSIYRVERYCDSTIHHSCLITVFMPVC